MNEQISNFVFMHEIQKVSCAQNFHYDRNLQKAATAYHRIIYNFDPKILKALKVMILADATNAY